MACLQVKMLLLTFAPMSPLIRPLRSLANGLGFAWWARVHTSGPDVTYWFGPFISKSGLKSQLSTFLDDINSEHPQSISHSLLRTRRGEPLTITSEG
jgi:hypothetical protein